MITSDEILNEAREKISEYTEMSDNPDRILSFYLSGMMVGMYDEIEYLRKRLNYAETH